MQLPLRITAASHGLDVHDATGARVVQAHSKWYRAKLAVDVFDDQSTAVGRIETDDVIDLAGTYRFIDASGQLFGRSHRRGVKSLFRVRHDIDAGDGSQPWQLREERPWVRFLDAAFGRIPLLGMFAGYILNPTYIVRRGEDTIARLRQLRAFRGRCVRARPAFTAMSDPERQRLLYTTLTFLLIERTSRARFALPSGGGSSGPDHGALWR